MPLFRKKPVEVEAMLFTGTNKSLEELTAFVGPQLVMESVAVYEPVDHICDAKQIIGYVEHPHIRTLEGLMHVSVGDYVIKGVQGEFYPCKPDIFAATYEEVV